mmetsp:Transcript_107837/g.310636  ORF Transcript_107837/g.310636 Transcript_107837/m.310636 type:complete len:207 (+) Transcript_107837:205-825(+)
MDRIIRDFICCQPDGRGLPGPSGFKESHSKAIFGFSKKLANQQCCSSQSLPTEQFNKACVRVLLKEASTSRCIWSAPCGWANKMISLSHRWCKCSWIHMGIARLTASSQAGFSTSTEYNVWYRKNWAQPLLDKSSRLCTFEHACATNIGSTSPSPALMSYKSAMATAKAARDQSWKVTLSPSRSSPVAAAEARRPSSHVMAWARCP